MTEAAEPGEPAQLLDVIRRLVQERDAAIARAEAAEAARDEAVETRAEAIHLVAQQRDAAAAEAQALWEALAVLTTGSHTPDTYADAMGRAARALAVPQSVWVRLAAARVRYVAAMHEFDLVDVDEPSRLSPPERQRWSAAVRERREARMELREAEAEAEVQPHA